VHKRYPLRNQVDQLYADAKVSHKGKIMKKIKYVFVAGMLLTGTLFAEDLATLTAQPAAAQEYRAAGSTNVSAAAMQQAAVAALPIANPAVAPAAQAVMPAEETPDKSVSIVTNTQKEITDLAQNTLSFQQQADQRIQALIDSNHAMGTVIQSLMQNVAVLQQQLVQKNHGASGVAVFLSSETGIMLIFACAVLFLSAGVFLGRMGRQQKVAVTKLQPDVKKSTATAPAAEPEYDFMNTPQAIPAKLDLARSYIAMNDIEQAKSILNAIIERGDDLQRREARGLLESFKS